MGGGGGFRATQRSDQRARKRDLLAELDRDETVSDITKDELRADISGVAGLSEGAGSGNRLSQIESILAQAREGTDPKFAGRQLQQRFKNIKKDRPGRSQTVLTR